MRVKKSFLVLNVRPNSGVTYKSVEGSLAVDSVTDGDECVQVTARPHELKLA